MEQDIINRLYNLILDTSLTDEERSLLIYFKNQVIIGKNEPAVIRGLSEQIRQLAVKNISDQKTLSPNMADFYQKIATYGHHNHNLARGLMALGGLLN